MNEELPGLINQASTIADEAQKAFGHLSPEQLNWKPSPEQWSVAQCFEHLIVINSSYFPLIKKIAQSGYKPTLQERLPLVPRFFGSMILKVVEPQAPRKFKAASKFQPSSSAINGGIIARFKAHQQEMIQHMKMTEKLNLKKTIITSPAASIATYSLQSAYNIIVAHERRHIAQAKRVMEAPGFPKNTPSTFAAS